MRSELLKPQYETLIFTIRAKKVMIDTALASLYQVPTKALKQQVKRNRSRFPEDFMFRLTKAEKKELVTNCDRLTGQRHSTVLPMAFTEQGVAMLSSVLRSEKAIRINIEIMRAFSRYRALLHETRELRDEIKNLDRKLNGAFRYLLKKLDALHQTSKKARNPIGFRLAK